MVGSVSSLVLTVRWWRSLRRPVSVVVGVACSHHALVLVVDGAVVPLPGVLPPIARAGELVVHGRTPPVHEHRLQQQEDEREFQHPLIIDLNNSSTRAEGAE